jgi:hypothetical protein
VPVREKLVKMAKLTENKVILPHSNITYYLIGLILVVMLKAQNITPPFDVKKVISEMHQHNNAAVSRDNEFLIDTNVVYAPAYDFQGYPAIAYDGYNYMVVWEDDRSGYPDIYGARVSSSGIILDSAGIAISTTYNAQWKPAIAFDGTNYFVVWSDFRDAHYTSRWDIYGARVSPSGSVLDTAGIPIAATGAYEGRPAVAFNGSDYLVVWEEEGYWPHENIYGRRIDQSGIIIDTNAVAISTAIDRQVHPAVASNGEDFLVVWRDERNGIDEIYGSRVTAEGVVLDSAGIPISTVHGGLWPSVAFDGTNYLVVFQNATGIQYVQVAPAGIVLDTTKWVSPAGTNPKVSFCGSHYLVIWSEIYGTTYYDIFGKRVNTSGVVIDTSRIVICNEEGSQWSPSIAFGDSNFLVAWADTRNFYSYYYDIYSARVSTTGITLDTSGNLISVSANFQENPSLAFSDTNYLVVWQERNVIDSSYDIYGTRVSPYGATIDSLGIPISTANLDQRNPSVAFDGTNYLVVWQDSRNGYYDIYGTRVSPYGMVIDSLGIAISTASSPQRNPSVAFDGTNYLVVWDDRRNGSYYDIYGARIDSSGTVLDPDGIEISCALYNQTYPSVSFSGSSYLVVWEDARSYEYSSEIYGARITPSGVVLDPLGIDMSTSNQQYHPSLAFDGNNYLVVWASTRHDSFDIYGTRVDTSGTVLDPDGILISPLAGNQGYPIIAFDGTYYLAAWQDWYSADISDICGAKIDTAGTVLNTYTISTQQGNKVALASASGHSNQILITYSGFTDSIGIHPANTMRIWGKFYPFVGVTEQTIVNEHISNCGLQIYPNPFRNRIEIRYIVPDVIPGTQEISLIIYDITGRSVKSFNPASNVGHHESSIFWSGADDANRKLPCGVYFVKLWAGDYSATKKLLLIR